MERLSNKVALITGASKGIGASIVMRFLEEGAIVYANTRKEEDFKLLQSQCSQIHLQNLKQAVFDVNDFSLAKKALMSIKKESNRLDILVNNAGVVTYELMQMIDFDSLRKMFETNVISAINMINLSSRLMSRKKDGSIINILSIVGTRGAAGQLGYSATKGALESVTKSAAKELASSTIRVNGIAPGMIKTERFEKVMSDKFSDKVNSIGFGRLGNPEEIADACLFFACDESKYITGQILEVDGLTRI